MTDEELGFIEAGVRDGCAFTAATVEALLARLRAAEAERDCGQAGACAVSPGCQRHWQERNAELVRERDEARAALIRAQEDHRAAVEALETYEQRIGDIADHVLGLVPSDTPSIVKLDAIERRCGEERIAARRAESRAREMEAELDRREDATRACWRNGEPSNGRIAWALWGGDAGRRWANGILRRLTRKAGKLRP